jgi:hypothetical protein
MDMVIGTNVNNNNETENFELSQILSLYPQITQKASLYSSVNQVPVVNTDTTITFDTTQFATTGLTPLPSGGPTFTGIQIGNGGYYRVDCSFTLKGSVSGGEFRFWLRVNGVDIGPAYIENYSANLGNGNVTFNLSYIYDFTAADIVSIAYKTSTSYISLQSVVATGTVPMIPSARILISQV